MKTHRALPTVMLLVAGSMAAGPRTARARTTGPAARTPVVVADGGAVVRRMPDRAYVTFGVESRAQRPEEATRRNAGVMTAVQRKLLALGIPRTAIATVSYQLQQEFDFVDNKRVPKDYLASNTIRVTLDDLARIGPTIDAAVHAGANDVRSIRFDLRDRRAAEREALKEAAADARARAEAAAAGVGETIGRILRLDATSAPAARPVAAPLVRAGQSGAETPIAPGQIEIRARVTLTAELKQER